MGSDWGLGWIGLAEVRGLGDTSPMRLSRHTLILAILAALILPAIVWLALYWVGAAPAPGRPMQEPFNLSDRIATIEVEKNGGEGEPAWVLVFPRRTLVDRVLGRPETGPVKMSPEEFAELVFQRRQKQNGLFRLLDVTSWTGLWWFGFGIAAQTVFMGRMIVQWWAAEKAKSAVVPPSFWWLSLVGSSMLLIYFIWRKEVVGFLGQSTGWLIYIRNLWFIYGQDPVKR